MERYGNTTRFYTRSDHMYHYKSELPKSLWPFVNYVFSSGVLGDGWCLPVIKWCFSFIPTVQSDLNLKEAM